MVDRYPSLPGSLKCHLSHRLHHGDASWEVLSTGGIWRPPSPLLIPLLSLAAAELPGYRFRLQHLSTWCKEGVPPRDCGIRYKESKHPEKLLTDGHLGVAVCTQTELLDAARNGNSNTIQAERC